MNFVVNKNIEEIADTISSSINKKLESDKKVLWLLSGGSAVELEVLVSKKINKNLSSELIITLVDERYGPIGHADSNWSSLINQGFIFNNANFIPFLSNENFIETTDSVDGIISDKIKESNYRIGIFGIGEDGHTAGILPYSEALSSNRFVCGYETPKFRRITITGQTIKMLDEVFVFAYGENKWKVLENFEKETSEKKEPSQLLKMVPLLTIFTDYIKL